VSHGDANESHGGRLRGPLFTECAEWIWEQLQEEEGMYVAGELIELILTTERELGAHAESLDRIVTVVADEFRMRGVGGSPLPVDRQMIRAILEWEDEFLGLAGITREES
jgi:hypothetical protein